MPDACFLSLINPTAGPTASPKEALKLPHKAAVRAIAKTTTTEPGRETEALNDLAAADYGQFHDLHRVGRIYQATVDDPHDNYLVAIDPDNGHITRGD